MKELTAEEFKAESIKLAQSNPRFYAAMRGLLHKQELGRQIMQLYGYVHIMLHGPAPMVLYEKMDALIMEDPTPREFVPKAREAVEAYCKEHGLPFHPIPFEVEKF